MPFKYQNIEIQRILNQSDIQELLNLYNSKPVEKAHQDYNLFLLEKRRLTRKDAGNLSIAKISDYAKKIYNLELAVHYFLKYKEWSFTKFHADNPGSVEKTFITPIDLSEDLVGGEALFMEKYLEPSQEENSYFKNVKNKRRANGEDLIPIVAPEKIGRSIIYGANVKHAVTQVRRGHRIVLVSWFKHQ